MHGSPRITQSSFALPTHPHSPPPIPISKTPLLLISQHFTLPSLEFLHPPTAEMRRRGIIRETPETKLKKEFLKVPFPFPSPFRNTCTLAADNLRSFAVSLRIGTPSASDKRGGRFNISSLCADCPCDNDNYIRRANARLGIFLCF